MFKNESGLCCKKGWKAGNCINYFDEVCARMAEDNIIISKELQYRSLLFQSLNN
jgi:hypothetical protein